LNVKRFEKDLFAVDTNNLRADLKNLEEKYPDFLPLYIEHVLGLGPIADTNELAYSGTKLFLKLNRKPYEKSEQLYANFDQIKNELTETFRYCKYYFPQYPVPAIITTVGPMDALAPMSNYEPSPNFIGKDFLAIGLQFYLGKDFDIYNDPNYISQIAPAYRSRRFTKDYIVADVIKLVVDDMFPDSSSRLAFGEQMIERGKRVALLKRLMPYTNDTIILGYTKDQLQWVEKNERTIYNYFTQSGLLYELDPILIRPYLTDGPFTRELGESSPGNIATYTGWRIVESYLKNSGEKSSLAMLMRLNSKEILAGSKYTPR
jgi:hypothetical protein